MIDWRGQELVTQQWLYHVSLNTVALAFSKRHNEHSWLHGCLKQK